MAILFNPHELQYLQQTLSRWHDYKGHGAGGGTFSDVEHKIVEAIQKKVQVTSGTPVSFTPREANFLKNILYVGKQDYGRGSGNSVFETGVRAQVQQRTVQINGAILAKLNNEPVPVVNPGETEALES